MLGVRRDVRLRGCKVNSHWRPQHCFCSIARFRNNYRVIPFANMSVSPVSCWGGGGVGAQGDGARPLSQKKILEETCWLVAVGDDGDRSGEVNPLKAWVAG